MNFRIFSHSWTFFWTGDLFFNFINNFWYTKFLKHDEQFFISQKNVFKILNIYFVNNCFLQNIECILNPQTFYDLWKFGFLVFIFILFSFFNIQCFSFCFFNILNFLMFFKKCSHLQYMFAKLKKSHSSLPLHTSKMKIENQIQKTGQPEKWPA